jgi:cobalamin transport system substrate-binding protein
VAEETMRNQWVACAALTVVSLAWQSAQAEPAGTAAADSSLVEHHPSRVVSLTPSVTETLFALGLGGRVVGVSAYCDFPPEAARLPRVGTFLAPVIEQVVGLEPDLVITSPSPSNHSAVAAMERAGLRVAVVSEGSESLRDATTAVLQAGAAVGAAEAARRLVDVMEADVGRVRRRVEGLTRLRAAIVVGTEPLVLAGPHSYLGELLEIGGGTNVAAEVGGKWPRTSWEFLLAAAPEVIVDLSPGAPGRTADDLGQWSRWDSLPAVRDRRVYAGDGTLLLRPGPRLPRAAESVARLLHPEAWRTSD